MKLVTIDSLEEQLKLFLTNPETTDNLDEAVKKAKEILQYKEDSSYGNYAIALYETKVANMCAPLADYSKVIQKYEKIIKNDKNFLEAYLMLAKIYHQVDKQKQVEILTKANEQFPDHYIIMYDLANLKLFHTGDKEGGLELFTKCVQKLPQVDSAWASLGSAYMMNRELEMGKTCYETALSINPEKLSATLGIGVYYFENGNFKKAREYYEKSLMINKDSFWGNFNIALLEILEGNFEKGMKLYEKRDKEHYVKKYGGSGYPELEKHHVEKNADKKIVVIKEQGFGDDIMFSRYLKPLKNLGYTITFATAPELLDLFKASPDLEGIKVTNSVPAQDVTAFDHRTFLLSLPYLTSNFVKGKPDPLSIDMKKIDEGKVYFSNNIRNKIESKKFKIGLSWNGSPKHWRDKNRSIEPELLKDLLKNKDVEFFALQKIFKDVDKKFIKDMPNLTNCSEDLKDFVHTAYLVNKMDLILTVDTSLVHLAGSVGKETYMFLPTVPDWRWGLKDKQDWYPNVHLLRQEKIDDWGKPISRAKKIIKEKLSS